MNTRFLNFDKRPVEENIQPESDFWNEDTSRLICFETSDWSTSTHSNDNLALRPTLLAMSPTLLHPFHLHHSYIANEESLYNWVQHPNSISSKVPFVYMAFHGIPGGITYDNNNSGSGIDELVHPFISATEAKRVIYIGACSVFRGSEGELLAQHLLEQSKSEAVLGYSSNAKWYDATFLDLLFISRFYNSPAPFYELKEIYKSVIDDFAPAKTIGLKMFSRTELLV
jgi:hypothetical protein